MPSRGSYQIANRDEGKAAERDQSYRSCILAMLIFFLLCIVLIVVSLPWKLTKGPYHRDETNGKEFAKHHRDETARSTMSVTDRTTTATPATTRTPSAIVPEVVSTTTTLSDDIITEQIVIVKKRPFERISVENKTTTLSEIGTTVIVNLTEGPTTTLPTTTSEHQMPGKPILIVHDSTKSTESTTEFSTEVAELSTTEYTEKYDRSTQIISDDSGSNETISNHESHLVTSITDTSELTSPLEETGIPETDTTQSTKDSPTEESTEVFGGSSTNSSDDDAQGISESTTETVITNAYNYSSAATEFSVDYTTVNYNKTETANLSTKESSTIVDRDTTISRDASTVTTISEIYTTAQLELDDRSQIKKHDSEVCESGQCKQIASKLLSYMNHSADPCEDFYEYACGGMEADPQIIEKDLSRNVHRRIGEQMIKEGRDGTSFTFSEYFNSCMHYEKNVNRSERIKYAKKVLSAVGKFYTTDNWSDTDYKGITDLLSKLLLYHSPLLFDVVPDIPEEDPQSFTLRIGPTTYKSPFNTETTQAIEDDSCFTNEFQKSKADFVNLDNLYRAYKTCKNDNREFIRSIKEILIELDAFGELSHSYNITQYIDLTLIHIDLEIVQGFKANFPSKSKIREAYLTKNYTKISFGQLQQASTLVNWSQLVHSLTGFHVLDKGYVQIYFYEELMTGLRYLEHFVADNIKHAMFLNNAILALYAHKVYHELVLSQHNNKKDHCVRVAANLLAPEAAYLYITSFSDNELLYMNKTSRKYFDALKDTLTLKVQAAEWVVDEARLSLLKKIAQIELILPDVSYFKNRELLYGTYGADSLVLSNNYFENSMVLLRRYRSLIYGLKTQPSDPKEIWTYYTTPFHSKGLALYSLNYVVVPFGSMDWSMLSKYNENSLDYLTLATLGNLMAQQIAHHFDANGIHYWNGTRDQEYSLLNEDESSNTIFKDYINCQRDILYQSPLNMILPSTEQNISFTIPQLTLNERLSDLVGLRLAYDTLTRLTSPEDKRLPWTELNVNQLFYVAYTQMYCTKVPLVSSYVSLHENEHLPSRVRIFVSTSNDRLVGEAWNCPTGSKIVPADTCNTFPHLESRETVMSPE